MTANTQTEKTVSTTPSHYVYQVLERKNREPFWRRIGTAWAAGDGFNVNLECLPLEGRIALRLASEKKE